MRILFVAGFACAAFTFVQCTPRQFNSGSEVKDVKDISSVQDDGNGKFNVVCKDGRTEQGVTDEAIKRGDVCKSVPPSFLPFNAFNIWRDGTGAEILDYPQGYDVTGGSTTPDGVFYVEIAEYWKEQKFIGVPTEGTKVVNDVLEYPVKNGKQLKLKFTKISEKEMVHPDAVTYCKYQGLRLPTARELFDFCAAGVTEPNYGPNYQTGKYPSTARCGSGYTWSASVGSYGRNNAWLFRGNGGNVYLNNRSVTYGVRCVGGG